MDWTTCDILIISVEGPGQRIIERYVGARTPEAIRKRLSRERKGRDSRSEVWIECYGKSDGNGNRIYGKLNKGLDSIELEQSVEEDKIRDTHPARLASA